MSDAMTGRDSKGAANKSEESITAAQDENFIMKPDLDGGRGIVFIAFNSRISGKGFNAITNKQRVMATSGHFFRIFFRKNGA